MKEKGFHNLYFMPWKCRVICRHVFKPFLSNLFPTVMQYDMFVRWSEKKTSYPLPACFIDFLALNRQASYSGVISMLCSLVSRIRYFYERYTKELSFLSEMVCKKSRGWIGLRGPGANWNRVFYLNTTPSLILERGSEWDLMFSVICFYF